MWRKLFNAPWPDAHNVLPQPVQQQATRAVKHYWQSRGWELVVGEVILWIAAVYQGARYATAYGLLAILIAAAYLSGFLSFPTLWLLLSSGLFLLQGMLINGLGPVTALSFIIPYTFAGMLLDGRRRVMVQTWCSMGFWIALIYNVVPVLPQLDPPNYLLISYDILLAVFIFQTLRFLNHLTVEINSTYVAGEIREQSQQFLARVSHELRTPLNSVLGFAKLLRRADLPETQANYLRQIIGESEQLNRLVSDLLDSAHLSTGKLTLHLEPCNINALCQTVADEHLATLPTTLSLKNDFALTLPTLNADQVRLRQALGNLVSNAVKYTPEGEITLRTYQQNHMICIDVQDSGIGISENQHALVFVPFVQLNNHQIGVGLGLDIALQIIRLHGGDIKLVSAPSKGSIFTIQLPIE